MPSCRSASLDRFQFALSFGRKGRITSPVTASVGNYRDLGPCHDIPDHRIVVESLMVLVAPCVHGYIRIWRCVEFVEIRDHYFVCHRECLASWVPAAGTPPSLLTG